jgi:hypothetical protein
MSWPHVSGFQGYWCVQERDDVVGGIPKVSYDFEKQKANAATVALANPGVSLLPYKLSIWCMCVIHYFLQVLCVYYLSSFSPTVALT